MSEEKTTTVAFDAEEMLKRLMPKYVEKLEKDFADNVISALDWRVKNEIDKLMGDFFEKELISLLSNKLNDRKAEIAEHIAKAVAKSFEHLADAIIDKAVKNVANSWKMEKVLKELLG